MRNDRPAQTSGKADQVHRFEERRRTIIEVRCRLLHPYIGDVAVVRQDDGGTFHRRAERRDGRDIVRVAQRQAAKRIRLEKHVAFEQIDVPGQKRVAR